MELNYDWKGFQTLFYSKKRLNVSESLHPIYLVTDDKTVVSAFCDGEDLSDWVGATYDEMLVEFSNRELVLYDRENVDEMMNLAVDLNHFYDQIQFLRKKAHPHMVTKS